MTDPVLWTLSEASAAIGARRISSTELLEAVQQRIAAWQPVTNAFIDQRITRAREAAQAADREIASAGPRSPLHGIPLAHKDMYYREGLISTCGSGLRRQWRAPHTATVLHRLDAAGAIEAGTLNMAEWAGGATGHNKWFGDACNPWNAAYATGGSSSGSGAAIAARMVFGALGSDTGGSIRLPASMCGVAGLKPTWGAVSRYGVMPRAWTLDCVGPLARTAADCAMLFAAIAGPDPEDATSLGAPRPVMPEPPRDLRGSVLGIEATLLEAADATIRPALDAALNQLRDLGAELRPVSLPDLEILADYAAMISGAEAASLHGEQMAADPDGYAPEFLSRTQSGLAVPAVLYLRAMRARGPLLAAVMSQVFAQCDALICPTMPLPVPTRAGSRITVAEDVGRVHGPLVRLTRPASYLGLPALSVPCGFDPADMPVGLQVIGAPFDEAAILRIGMAYEEAAGWHRQAPVLPN